MTVGTVHPLAVYSLLAGRPFFCAPGDLAVAELRDFFLEEAVGSARLSADGSEVAGSPGRRLFFSAAETGPRPSTLRSGPESGSRQIPGIFEEFREAGFITEAPSMLPALRVISRLSGKLLPIHLEGGSGVGKEIIARYIHDHSGCRTRPFVAVNCGAIPHELVESELFGHKKGAFTGANKDSAGLVLSAQGGTLFLDEIGDLPLTTQVKLLRVLETKAVRPVGGMEEKPVDFRLVTATNKNLEQEVRAGRFRDDFFYRLGTTIEIPSLRRRKTDIPVLVCHFIEHFLQENKETGPVSFESDFLDRLMAHDWPGNVRELKHVIEHTMAIRERDTLRVQDLPPSFQETRLPDDGLEGLKTLTLARALEIGLKPDELTLYYFRLALELCGNNLDEVAALMGVSPATVYRRRREIDGTAPKKNGGTQA